mgnify:CR=1 FL=1
MSRMFLLGIPFHSIRIRDNFGFSGTQWAPSWTTQNEVSNSPSWAESGNSPSWAGSGNLPGPAGRDQTIRPVGQDWTIRPIGQDQAIRPAGRDQAIRPAGQNQTIRPAGQDHCAPKGQIPMDSDRFRWILMDSDGF